MFQTQVYTTQAQGVVGEYADDSPRREQGYILLSNDTAGTAATGKLAFTANPTAGDTVTIGSVVYRFESTMTQANDIQIGSALTDTLASLEKTINGEGAEGTDYYAGTTTPLSAVTASVSSNDLTLTATTDGTSGNAIALATSNSGNVTVTPMSGGTNATSVLPQFACAFTQSSQGNGYAQLGGNGLFAGVLVNPKMYANYMNLAATLTLPSGSQGGLCTFGHIYVQPTTAYAIGNIAAFDPATGAINAYVNAEAVPEGFVTIQNAQFIKYSGDANTVAVLELGN